MPVDRCQYCGAAHKQESGVFVFQFEEPQKSALCCVPRSGRLCPHLSEP